MSFAEPDADKVETLLSTPDLAHALESEHFRRFLDQVPIAIAVGEMQGPERIVYANPDFEKLTGRAAKALVDRPWSVIGELGQAPDNDHGLGQAILRGQDFIGTFRIVRGEEAVVIDAYSNVIEDEDGKPAFRLAALVDVTAHQDNEPDKLTQQLREKDTLLREVQHRVKNNLQMITALIRIEARNARKEPHSDAFERLAGRIEAIHLLYRLLSDNMTEQEIDLGIYISQVAAAVLQAQASAGIRLDMKVDIFPVSVNVAMPTGLVINELLTNSLKHAFRDREGGTITLHSLVDEHGCRITVADDGIGLSEGSVWPQPGKLSYAIMQSLKENAKAKVEVTNHPGEGMRVTITFARSNATVEAAE
ncbi:PAS domain S-box protein [Acidisoma cellulosilytica]|uniref:histidine kinase n=1 Tax=Acidisoma cellulosilyticum TaxID=2802395 RepID=A0A963Z609_9PROT|nr:PAS domain-containing sensor histidine kinase [Acidisoma cellulosilyticum]MCB8883258.1 PAS domain S-box protein [Acidisoma cellulosilyticum]